MEDNNKVVYRHRKLSNGVVFYVGYGTPERPYDEIHRTNWWKNTAEKHGYTTEILATGLSKKDAGELEALLIQEYGRKSLGTGPLVNLLPGGEGSSGYKHTESAKDKIRQRFLGIKKTESHKKKIKLAKENLSEEELNRLRGQAIEANRASVEVRSKKVIVEFEETLQEYLSINEVIRFLKLNKNSTLKKLEGVEIKKGKLKHLNIYYADRQTE